MHNVNKHYKVVTYHRFVFIKHSIFCRNGKNALSSQVLKKFPLWQ